MTRTILTKNYLLIKAENLRFLCLKSILNNFSSKSYLVLFTNIIGLYFVDSIFFAIEKDVRKLIYCLLVYDKTLS